MDTVVWAIANWKMNGTLEEAMNLSAHVVAGLNTYYLHERADVVVGLAPPFTFLQAVNLIATQGTRYELVAQDCHPEPKGAYTGAVSVPMLASLGVARVIVGHSERRKHFGEDDALIGRKLGAVLGGGLGAVLCVGERLEEREAGRERAVVEAQLRAALAGLEPGRYAPSAGADGRTRTPLLVAYEPVWAIGTGRNATPEQAGAMHAAIRSLLAELGAPAVPVIYGGSVTPDNVRALARTEGVSGVLVGGASLVADSFVEIVRACAER